MSLTGKAAKSHKKQDLLNQKSPAVGFKALRFAHKATAGDTGFSVNALVIPTEMAALGFTQPTPAELQATNLQFYKRNLTLVSSARGVLNEALDFVVAGNGQINFSDQFGVALADEIFVGTVDPVARTGNLLADTVFILDTGTLAADATDIPVGRSFLTNANSSMQVGAVQVFIEGQLQFRNVANATAAPSADGNYEEVDNGSGASTLIRLNNSDPSPRSYIVMSTQLSVVNPDGSLLEDLQRQQGTIDRLVEEVAILASLSETDFQGTPTQPQLKQFGDRVVLLEQNRARIDTNNTWTAAQTMLGFADGSVAASGKLGEQQIGSRLRSSALGLTTATSVDIATITIGAGTWLISSNASFNPAASTSFTLYRWAVSKTSNTLPGVGALGVPDAGEISQFWTQPATVPTNDVMFTAPTFLFNTAISVTLYLVVSATFTVSTTGAYGSLQAIRIR